MQTQFVFFGSIAFSLIAWGMVATRYMWPELRIRQRVEALRPLLILHSFRFIGLAFLVPGVVSPDLPSAFAHSAAYGDFIAAILALLALVLLPSASGVVIAWIFSVWGTADLFNAFYQANHAGLMAGQLGATYFIPTFIVPLLLITHGLGFWILLGHEKESVTNKIRQPAYGGGVATTKKTRAFATIWARSRPARRDAVWPGGYESLFPIFSPRAKTPGRLGVRLEVK